MKIGTKVVCTGVIMGFNLGEPIIAIDDIYELEFKLNEELFNEFAERMKNIKSVKDLFDEED